MFWVAFSLLLPGQCHSDHQESKDGVGDMQPRDIGGAVGPQGHLVGSVLHRLGQFHINDQYFDDGGELNNAELQRGSGIGIVLYEVNSPGEINIFKRKLQLSSGKLINIQQNDSSHPVLHGQHNSPSNNGML